MNKQWIIEVFLHTFPCYVHYPMYCLHYCTLWADGFSFFSFSDSASQAWLELLHNQLILYCTIHKLECCTGVNEHPLNANYGQVMPRQLSSAYQSPFQVTSLNPSMGPLGSSGGFYLVLQNNTEIKLIAFSLPLLGFPIRLSRFRWFWAIDLEALQ